MDYNGVQVSKELSNLYMTYLIELKKVLTCDTSYSKDAKWSQSVEALNLLLNKSNTKEINVKGSAINQPKSSFVAPDTRGNVVSEVCIRFPKGQNNSESINIHGVLNNGLHYDFDLKTSAENRFNLFKYLNARAEI